jgi:hypothetical protein
MTNQETAHTEIERLGKSFKRHARRVNEEIDREKAALTKIMKSG